MVKRIVRSVVRCEEKGYRTTLTVRLRLHVQKFQKFGGGFDTLIGGSVAIVDATEWTGDSAAPEVLRVAGSGLSHWGMLSLADWMDKRYSDSMNGARILLEKIFEEIFLTARES